MNLDKDEDMFCKRILDLANTTYQQSRSTFTDFLNLNEYQLFLKIQQTLTVSYTIEGGFIQAERRMIGFHPSMESIGEFPIACLQISCKSNRFSETLTHRDYLGAILNLGIERSKIGDIIIDDSAAYVFCNQAIASFIMSECTRVKHTTIQIKICDFNPLLFETKYSEIKGTVASFRIDCVLSVALPLSRSRCIELINGGQIYCNHRIVLSKNFLVSDGDLISIRGTGRFKVRITEDRVTKKGKHPIVLLKYL